MKMKSKRISRMHCCIIYKLIKVTGYILEWNETEHKSIKIMTCKKNYNKIKLVPVEPESSFRKRTFGTI